MSAAWTADRWLVLDRRVRRRTAACAADHTALVEIRRASREILRGFSGSFFLVTRFLPPKKRSAVEIIYAAVRYPDEIVDSFPLPSAAMLQMLEQWEQNYFKALDISSIRGRLRAGIPWILAGFAEVARQTGIPAGHYRSFLAAMRRDAQPLPYATFDDLIARYVYGSAIVVGYFLAHVYGTAPGASMDRAYHCAADLGIGLQLTNFARDVTEDRGRGRIYIPADVLASRGERAGVAFLAEAAEDHYARAVRDLEVFAADCRPAIRACIDVYRQLNRRILQSEGGVDARHSVPLGQKFGALPPSKYWRVPLAYLGGL